jgi:(1->4)-alpha-D-glucan 1-alpha-D-glucosylmutase
MLASSTHDTKRGEDTRARINVLSEFGGEWPKILDALHAAGAPVKTGGGPVANDEYMIYQTLLGVWPDDESGWPRLADRLKQYVTKAVREAKLYSSWTDPNEAYEKDCLDFVEGLIASRAFMAAAAPVAAKVVKFGYLNSLSQTLLKLTVPGMPDIYQGSELWNFSLADPDNRQAVDYEARARLIAEAPALHQLMKTIEGPAGCRDGAIKLRLVQRLCGLRRSAQELFETGDYQPVNASGAGAGNVVAFTRGCKGQELFVACGRLMTKREAAGTPPGRYAWDWGDTTLTVPEGEWRDMLNGGKVHGGVVSAGALFGALPIAVWGMGVG